MGAWDVRVLDNDEALDTLGSLIDSDKDIRDNIYDLFHGETYIENLMLACEIVDISINGIDKDILGPYHEDYIDWIRQIENEDLSDLKEDALHVIKACRSRDTGWTPDCVENRKKVWDAIECRLSKGIS